MPRWLTVAIGAALVLLALAVPAVLPPFFISLATEMLVFGLLAMSINLMGGYAGLMSLGHAGIFGVSAYTVAYLVTRVHAPAPVAFVAGTAMALAVGSLFGALAIRASGIYFLMITLAEGMIVWGLAYRWADVTGAENGIRGVARPAFIAANWQYYYAALVIFALCAWLMRRVIKSPFGLTLMGLRDAPTRMRTLGYNISMHKFVGFLLACFFGGVAGALYAFYNRYVSPSTVNLSVSSEAVLMVVLGGVGTFWGPLLGAVFIVLGRNMISLYTARWPIVMGLIYILVMVFARNGILGTLQMHLERGAADKRARARAAVKEVRPEIES